MRHAAAALAVGLACCTGCGKEAQPSPSPATGLAGDVEDIAADTALLREAQAAVNEVVRAIPDCEAVKAAMADARATLDDAAAEVRTEAGRVSLGALEAQLRKPAEFCP
jgi:hypothetical protein